MGIVTAVAENFAKRLNARTTGRVKGKVKKAEIPGYGKKGMGWIKDPKKGRL